MEQIGAVLVWVLLGIVIFGFLMILILFILDQLKEQ